MAITRGIATSSFQDPTPTSAPSDDIDWNLVERTAQDFAIIRLTIGRTTTDVTGLRDLRGALSEGVPIVGAYGVCGYAEPVEDGAKVLVDRAATVADPATLAFMVDAEDFGDGRHPTIGQVNRYAIQLHHDTGRWPAAYVPGWWMSKYGYSVAGLELRHCPWAQSHYFGQPWTDERLQSFKPTNLRGFDRLAWLQFASSGSLSGVATRVDLNAAYMTVSELRVLLGLSQQQGDISMDDATKAYLDTMKGDILTRINLAVQRVGGRTNSVYNNQNVDYQGLVMARDIQQLDAAAVAALVAGQLEVTGISTGAGGVVTVTFGPKA